MPHFRVQCGVKIEHYCCYACYGYLQGTPNVRYFSRPITLCKLARFLRESWITTVSSLQSWTLSFSVPLQQIYVLFERHQFQCQNLLFLIQPEIINFSCLQPFQTWHLTIRNTVKEHVNVNTPYNWCVAWPCSRASEQILPHNPVFLHGYEMQRPGNEVIPVAHWSYPYRTNGPGICHSFSQLPLISVKVSIHGLANARDLSLLSKDHKIFSSSI